MASPGPLRANIMLLERTALYNADIEKNGLTRAYLTGPYCKGLLGLLHLIRRDLLVKMQLEYYVYSKLREWLDLYYSFIKNIKG